MDIAKELLHQRNLAVVNYVTNLDKKYKRILLNRMKDSADNNSNIIFPRFNCITLGEFCTTQTLLKVVGDNKTTFTDALEERMNKKQKI